jgi:hypothetical protein
MADAEGSESKKEKKEKKVRLRAPLPTGRP